VSATSRLFLMVVLMLSQACSEGRQGETAQGGALVGRWRVQFFPNPGSGGSVEGAVRLDSVVPGRDQCPPYLGECSSMVRGVSQVGLGPLLGHNLSGEVVAGLDSDGEVVFLFGTCCDRGELSARGRLVNGQIRGRWHETLVGGGRAGTFVLTRITDSIETGR